MDLLGKMTTFVRVVESGSLSAAARQLRISAPAVSRQLTTLEKELGVTLLGRTTRRMALTDAGRQYYERCTCILRDVADAQASARHEVEGSVKLSVPVAFGLAAVAPLLQSILRRHPGLVIDLDLDDRLVALAPEGIDIAIRVGVATPPSTDLIATPLVTYPRALVASPHYLKKHETPSRPEAIAQHDGLLFSAQTTWLLGDVRVRPKVVFRSNGLYVLRQLAMEGVGLTVLPEWFVAADLAARRLRRVLPAWPAGTTTATAIIRTELRGVPRVRALVASLREGLASLPHSAPRSLPS
jgi:DNA-binding transcriptional LysR family regulator